MRPPDRVMHQQINLYQPVFRRQHKVFSALTLVQILAAALILLLVLVVHARWTLAGLAATQHALAQQYAELQNRINTMAGGDAASDSQDLEQEIAQLGDAINQRHSLVEQFDRLMVQEQQGYARYFEALARERLPGLWITALQIGEGGGIEIRGKALEPRLVPVFLRRLGRLPPFAKERFASVILQRETPQQTEVDFIVHNLEASDT